MGGMADLPFVTAFPFTDPFDIVYKCVGVCVDERVGWIYIYIYEQIGSSSQSPDRESQQMIWYLGN
jgi:hypothetical protein